MSDVGRPENQLVPLSAGTVQERIKQQLEEVGRSNGSTLLTKYAKHAYKAGDWVIAEQPVYVLPLAFSDLISLVLRDEGNALIDETRVINNNYAGHSYRYVEALLAFDLDIIDLQDRLLVWADKVCKEVVYKTRHRAKEDPYGTYAKIYGTAIQPLDHHVAFRPDGMYQMVWSTVLDFMPFNLLDSYFVKSGAFVIKQRVNGRLDPVAVGRLANSLEAKKIGEHFHLYGLESISYVEAVVLDPLLEHLRQLRAEPSIEAATAKYSGMVNDLFEAYPYLMHRHPERQYGIQIPGSECYGCLALSPIGGIAFFAFNDTNVGMQKDLISTEPRGALNLRWDGELSFFMHPWRTLQHKYSQLDSLLLSSWLMEQVHERVVADYLIAEPLYREQLRDQSPVFDIKDEADDKQTALYTSWVKQARQLLEPDLCAAGATHPDNLSHTRISQIRRNLFFKVLIRCGVRIEQGKGSEIKLLRSGKHPFRLGNHGHVNPTIPSFLAANVLKRFEITYAEWHAAVIAG